jgi:hypothetical protein
MKKPLSETLSQYRPLYTITSTKPSSFFWTNFSASVTNRTFVHLSHIIADLCKQTNAGTSTSLTVVTNWFKHTNTRKIATRNISLGSPTLPAPKAGDFVVLTFKSLAVSLPTTRFNIQNFYMVLASR